MKRIVVSIVLMILGCSSVPSNAADISCPLVRAEDRPSWMSNVDWGTNRTPMPHMTCFGGILSGPISKGDYEKVETLLKTRLPYVTFFSLASPGGDVDEALKIGRLFRKYLIATIAPSIDLLTLDGGPELHSGMTQVCHGE